MNNYPECFMIHNWYPQFKKYTMKTEFLTLPKTIIEYIESDDFIHPEEYFKNIENISEFKNSFKNVIKKLGGSVFIKLLWSSPGDSSWLTFSNTSKISDFWELCLVLKNSESLSQEIALISQEYSCVNNLALRQPVEINEALEFRCFIKERKLIGICQRNSQFYFPFLKQMKKNIIFKIKNFIDIYFNPIWHHEPSLILDVYLNEHYDVKIMDIAPFKDYLVNPILFEWDELSNKLTDVDFRIIENDQEVVLLQKNIKSNPLEFSNFVGISSEDIIKTAVRMVESQEIED